MSDLKDEGRGLPRPSIPQCRTDSYAQGPVTMSAPGPFLFQTLPPTVLDTQYVTESADAIVSFVGTMAVAAELFARSLKLRYEGIAIASRMPRMMMTTRSSMRVKPLSSPASRCRSLLVMRGCSFHGERSEVATPPSVVSPVLSHPRLRDLRR